MVTHWRGHGHPQGRAWHDVFPPRASVPPVLAGLGLVGFLVCLLLLQAGLLQASDDALLARFALPRTPTLDRVAFIISEIVMMPYVMALMGPCVVYLWHLQRRALALGLLAVTLCSAILLKLLKYAVQRERPVTAHFAEDSGGFPSGHVIGAVVVYGLLAYVACRFIAHKFWQRVVIVACVVLLVLLSGAVRLYQQVHYPSDIYASCALGMACLFGGIVVCEAYERLHPLPGGQ